MKYLATLLLCCGLATTAQAADTEASRQAAADRYLKVMPMQSLMNDMASEVARQMPPEQRDIFLDLMQKQIDVSTLEKQTRASMVRIFSTNELNAMSRFYSSPEGQSIYKKMPQFMADIMPVMQAEMMKAVQAMMMQAAGAEAEDHE